jgi:phosphatidylserine decarboxylase
MKLARDGYLFVLPGIILLAVLVVVRNITNQTYLLYPIVALCLYMLFILFFFRDPDRLSPDGRNLILAPADGKVIALDENIPEYFDGYKSRLSIFLSILNVHINRIPIGGTVKRVETHRGRFFAAFTEKAHDANQHTVIEIENNLGRIGFCQRSGTIARRIVCNLKIGDHARCGSRFGLIRFGSRVDIYLPENVCHKVKLGQKVRAGETILAEYKK